MWLADHGNLVVDGRSGPFLDLEQAGSGGLGFTELTEGTGRLHAQFPHGTAVLVGAAAQVGGTVAATRIPAIEMALALAMWWFVIAGLTEPAWATVAIAALAVDLVTIHFSRDVFSEPLASALLAGALVLIGTRESRTRAPIAVAALAIGLSVGVRIDMIVVVLGVATLVLANTMLRRPGTALATLWGSLGVSIAFIDLVQRSPEYLHDRWAAVRPPIFAAAAVASLATIVDLAHQRAGRNADSRRTNPRAPVATRDLAPIAWAGAILILAGVAWALLIRPGAAIQHTGLTAHIAGLQSRDGLPIDGTRTYGENSSRWLVWYLGWPTIVLGAAGAAIVWRRIVLIREWQWLAPGLLLGPMTLLYLQRPRITGDQIWAMRRFLPTAMPLITILAVTAAGFLVARFRRSSPRASAGLAITIAAMMVIAPAATTWPLRGDRTMLWATYRIEELCRVLPDSAAVLVSSDQLLGDHLVRALARTCDVPAAVADPARLDLSDLSNQWHRSGRDLVVLAWKGDMVVGAEEVADFEMPQQLLEQAVDRRPARIESGTRVLAMWRVPVSD